jgi:hypothetical protein
MSLRDYDHDLAIRAYVGKFYRHLMTPLERRVTENDFPVTSNPERDIVKTYNMSSTMIEASYRKLQHAYKFLEDRDGHVNDADVLRAFEKPREEREAAAIARVLTECRDQIQINYCPECSRVLRTPIAKQCLWCGHDWHDAKKA